jgi:plasmid stabilization system protein ParE
MLKIIFTKKVENDLKNISTFISDDNPINAIKTVKSIINTIDLISLYPYI